MLKKKNIFSKLKYLIIAIIILVLGYFFGIIILSVIAIIIVLISIFFIISLFFSKSLLALTNRKVRLFIAMIFSGALSYLIIYLLRNQIFKISSQVTQIILIWVIATLMFGTLWNILVISKRRVYLKDNVIDYNKIGENRNLKFRDFVFILVIPTIITLIFNVLYVVI
ncbi:MAG: hypothetical protein WCY27_00690 [archaeon]|jgi:hypothetical protein|nr:hypothetical protein [archaeon]MDD2477386.1 hypothetical protein [Candidatus ainarchaeum sp.]MDD3084501.1 hypothetical protein [Candidatus ainarchaeum sp.]MDD4220782.1 hypothetical protein [Candidatus ainarchaeum sp.]MDD4662281.1 hypothetical protein [Candidatus ainarchaeum sp.]